VKAIFKSPGRINLIGEHTDYNGGYVLPAAIDRYTYVSVEESTRFEVYSTYFNEKKYLFLDDQREESEWLNYVKGALLYFSKRFKLRPYKITICGDLPMGAGLSSSASLVVGIIYALSKMERVRLSRKEIATMAHAVENEFVGVKCGIMDQYAVAMGRKNAFMLLNAFDGSFEYITVSDFPKMTVIDSGVKHRLSSGQYNLRRKECDQVEKMMSKAFRDMTLEDVKAKKELLGNTLYKRALHVLLENERVLKAVKAMKIRDWKEVGKLLCESHESLRNLFEVSTNEIDFIVEKLKGVKSVYGARMIGGGFGGSVLALSSDYLDEELRKISFEYAHKFGISMNFYHVNLSSSVRKIPRKFRA